MRAPAVGEPQYLAGRLEREARERGAQKRPTVRRYSSLAKPGPFTLHLVPYYARIDISRPDPFIYHLSGSLSVSRLRKKVTISARSTGSGKKNG